MRLTTLLLVCLIACELDPGKGGAGAKQAPPATSTGETGTVDGPTTAATTPAGGEVGGPCDGVADCVDVTTLPVQWTTGIGGIWWVPDQDYDGLRDLMIGSGTTATVYVLGARPFAVARADFPDAIAFTKKGAIGIEDVSGDGVPDFMRPTQDAASPRDYLAGPLVGDIDALPAFASVTDAGVLGDYDVDSALDVVVRGGVQDPGGATWSELHSGPISNWSGPASIRLEIVFDADEPLDCLELFPGFQVQDLDGDGVPEQLANGGGSWDVCPQQNGYVLPRSASGTYQLTRTGPSVPLDRYINGRLIQDQDGDGIQDTVYKAIDPVPGNLAPVLESVYSGPMAPVDGLWQPTGPLLLTLPTTESTLYYEPLWDVDGDGIGDWLEAKQRDGSSVGHTDFKLIRGGLDSLASPSVLGFWSTMTGSSHVAIPEEEALLVQTASGFAVVDLSTF